VVLTICTCTYLKQRFPSFIVRGDGFTGIIWKAARIGERKSPWVAVFCIVMGASTLFF